MLSSVAVVLGAKLKQDWASTCKIKKIVQVWTGCTWTMPWGDVKLKLTFSVLCQLQNHFFCIHPGYWKVGVMSNHSPVPMFIWGSCLVPDFCALLHDLCEFLLQHLLLLGIVWVDLPQWQENVVCLAEVNVVHVVPENITKVVTAQKRFSVYTLLQFRPITESPVCIHIQI